ncbi:MAG TPA: hypothetical protein VGG12_05230, partial [Methylovirgula sp.]
GERSQYPAGRPREAGIFVCVTGPSGVGKDTLIRLARAELNGRPEFLFPRRLITRPPCDFEDHQPLSPGEFRAGVRAGLFALAWEAHGCGYAIDASAGLALADGLTVVCNISRAAVPAARLRFEPLKLVAITAPDLAIAERLAGRGREDADAVSARMLRNAEFAVFCSEASPDITIVNEGKPEEAACAFAAFLIGLHAGPVVDHACQ